MKLNILIGLAGLILGVTVYSLNFLISVDKGVTLFATKSIAQNSSQQKPLRRTKLPVEGAIKIGEDSARAKIFVFVDYECPYCKGFFKDLLPELSETYINTGKVQLLVRNYPLEFHENAINLARVAHLADKNGTYVEFLEDFLDLDKSETFNYVKNLDTTSSVMSHIDQQIELDKSFAHAAGIFGTPTVVVGEFVVDNLGDKQNLFRLINKEIDFRNRMGASLKVKPQPGQCSE